MPRYLFRCPDCKMLHEEQRTVEDRDRLFQCNCGSWAKREIAPSNFTIGGFSAANGYSKPPADTSSDR